MLNKKSHFFLVLAIVVSVIFDSRASAAELNIVDRVSLRFFCSISSIFNTEIKEKCFSIVVNTDKVLNSSQIIPKPEPVLNQSVSTTSVEIKLPPVNQAITSNTTSNASTVTTPTKTSPIYQPNTYPVLVVSKDFLDVMVKMELLR